MRGLELGLQVFVDLEGLLHLLIYEELVRNGDGHKEFGGVGSSLQLGQLRHEPIEQVLVGALLTMHNVPLEGGIEVGRVAENLEETADAVLGLILGLALHIDRQVLTVEIAEDLVQQLKILERGFVVELHQGEVAHERRPVKAVNDDFDLGSPQRRCLRE